MSLNYSFIDTIKLIPQQFKYYFLITIIISSILLFIVLLINKKSKIYSIILIVLNSILIMLTCYFYLNKIVLFKFSNPINNLYFYSFNTIIFLILITITCIKFKKIIVNLVFYIISIIGISFSLFMTYYLNNVDIIVIGNILPNIKFGNILYIVYYIYIIVFIIKNRKEIFTNKKK